MLCDIIHLGEKAEEGYDFTLYGIAHRWVR